MVLYNLVLFLLVEIILFKMSAKVFYGYREIEPKWSSYDDIFNKVTGGSGSELIRPYDF